MADPAKQYLNAALRILLYFSLVVGGQARAGLRWSGYAKTLAVDSHSQFNGDSYWSDLSRLRLNTRGHWKNLDLDLKQDFELLSGSFLQTPEYQLIRGAPDPRYWHAQDELYRSRDLVARYQLYRGTLGWRSPAGYFRLGRQQVNWATGLIWSPMDILNPVSPLQLEPDERIGVDGLLWDHPWGPLGRISAVYAPTRGTGKQRKAVRIKRFVGGLDTSLMAGQFATFQAVGVSGAGNLGEAGWHGEAVWHRPTYGSAYWQAVLGATWATPQGLDLGLEGFYNGNPLTVGGPTISRLAGGLSSYRHRRYLGAFAEQDLTPFLHYRLVAVLDNDDHSGLLYPRLTWSLPTSQEIYLTLGGQVFFGSQATEYGSLRDLVLADLQWFF